MNKKILMMLRYLLIFSTIFYFLGCKDQPQSSNEKGGKSDLSMQADFAQRYPKAREIVWDTLEPGFAANFLNEDVESKAYFDSTGRFQYSATFIEQAALPKMAQDILDSKYKNIVAAVTMRVENAKTNTFQVELETDVDYISLEFDESGKLIKEEKHPLTNEEIREQEEEGVDQKDNK